MVVVLMACTISSALPEMVSTAVASILTVVLPSRLLRSAALAERSLTVMV